MVDPISTGISVGKALFDVLKYVDGKLTDADGIAYLAGGSASLAVCEPVTRITLGLAAVAYRLWAPATIS